MSASPELTQTTDHVQLHELIANDLRKQISTGGLPPGTPLPSEADLCKKFGASRGPVRQAVGALKAEGLVSSGRGRRSIVLESTPAQPFDVLYSFTQWCLDSGFEPGQQTDWMVRSRAETVTAAALDITEGDPVVSLLRLRTLDRRPAMVERLLYPIWVGQHILSFDPDSGSIYQRLSDQGVEIHHATRVIDAVAADEDDARLLQVNIGTPLLRMRRRAFTRDGRPVEDSDDRYLPDMTNFVLTTVRGSTPPFTIVAGDDDPASAPRQWR